MKQALQIAIDYMNDRLEDHDCKYQRHPATEAERINILVDIETVKEALAKQEQVCRDDGRCQYAIDSGAEGMGHCPKGKCVMPAKQEQGEPVAWKATWGGETKVFLFSKPSERDFDEITPLYAMPKKRNPLTDEQISQAFNEAMSKRPKDASNAETNRLFVREIEAVIEAMERTSRLDGSLINEGTKYKQEQGEPVHQVYNDDGDFWEDVGNESIRQGLEELGSKTRTLYTTPQQRKPQFKEFIKWAGSQGYDCAQTCNSNTGEWIVLNPMTADLWKAWQAAHGIKE